jgi:hypothetical protein
MGGECSMREKRRNSYKILVRKTVERGLFGGARQRLEHNIDINLKKK